MRSSANLATSYWSCDRGFRSSRTPNPWDDEANVLLLPQPLARELVR